MRFAELPRLVRDSLESADWADEPFREDGWWALIDECGYCQPMVINFDADPTAPGAGHQVEFDVEREMRIAAAWRHIAEVVHTRVSYHCFPVFTQRGPMDFAPVIQVVPKTLLGAIWWQFARAVMGEVTHRFCQVCGSVMELSTGEYGGRADKLFCTPKCKFKAHRMKVAEAKVMRAGGATLREIADKYGTKIVTVKRWLAPKR